MIDITDDDLYIKIFRDGDVGSGKKMWNERIYEFKINLI